MNIFDLLIVQPIFNALLSIYALLPGNDFGLSVIVFTVIVRLLMWPLVKKQLHQTKLMRVVQPELKRVKASAKGNRSVEAKLMMELYKKRGIKPFSSIGLLLIQLPIFIALFYVIQIISTDRQRIGEFVYGFVGAFEPVRNIILNPNQFNETLLGLVDLTRTAIGEQGFYWPLIVLSAIAAVFQYIQSKQTLPEVSSGKKLRDVFKSAADGKQVDQSEVTSLLTSRMIIFLPVILFVVSLYLPGALVLYYAASSMVAVVQQHYALKVDVSQAIVPVAAKATKVKKVGKPTQKQIEATPPKKKKGGKRKKRR